MVELFHARRTTAATSGVIASLRFWSVAGAVQAAIRSVDGDLAISSVRTIEDLANETLRVPRFTSALVGSFAAAALVLMVVGFYGLMAFTTSARLPEMGVRLALGARPAQVVRLIVTQGLRLAILGAAAGAVSTLLLADVLQTQLYEVTPTDPLTWVMVGVVVLVTAALACWRPARRAGRVDLAGVLKRDGA